MLSLPIFMQRFIGHKIDLDVTLPILDNLLKYILTHLHKNLESI